MNISYVGRPQASQVLATGTTAASSANPFDTNTMVVRLVATTPTFVDFNSTATTTKVYLPANTPEYFFVNGATHVSAVLPSGTGSLYITEMSH